MTIGVPVLDVAGVGADDVDRRFHRVHGGQCLRQGGADAEPVDRDRFLEALAQRRGGVGVEPVELAADPAFLRCGKVADDVLGLMGAYEEIFISTIMWSDGLCGCPQDVLIFGLFRPAGEVSNSHNRGAENIGGFLSKCSPEGRQ
jgi:hypothetical protein